LAGLSLKTRFENKVESMEGPCLVWKARRNAKGYGTIKIDGKSVLAHRVAYELYIGPIPEGLCVCHRCDHPSCVNPEHLFVGSHKDNMDDRDRKCRSKGAIGSRNTKAKLTAEQVLVIRADSRLPYRIIGNDYGISPAQVCSIKKKRTWAHL
jgi:hypothetical protein